MSLKKKVLAGILALGISTSAFADGLYDKVKDYLKDGRPKQELFFAHNLFGFQDDYGRNHTCYVTQHQLGDEVLMSQYRTSPLPRQREDNAMILPIAPYPSLYMLGDDVYLDPNMDGINGNEELYIERKGVDSPL